VRAARQSGAIGDVLLLLEHHPVYTRGRRSDPAELPMGEDWYLMQGIDIVATDRGGKVTYHGPGQLVGYPIVETSDVVGHIRTLEHAIVGALGEEGIDAHARPEDGPDYTGVWVGERKIASLGVHVQKGVTTHGFAVNVENDLQPFEWVVPCGLDGVRMTSVSRELRLGEPRGLAGFRELASRHVAQALGRQARVIDPADLDAAVSSTAPSVPLN
jgi:lipoyl(octanoyl) transferase